MFDAKALGDQIVSFVRDYVARATSNFNKRIDDLSEQIKSIPSGPMGERGEKGEPGRDGLDGKDGAAGPMGERGEKGEPGRDGLDGKSVTVDDIKMLLEAETAKWALEFERRAADVLQKAIDKAPVPKDGKDALELEDMTIEHDGDGLVVFRFLRGEFYKEFSFSIPRFKDKGVFKNGEQYKEGDGVTWSGSFFIAQKESPQGKPGESSDWRLAVKRGRDGKDAVVGSEKKQISPVRLK